MPALVVIAATASASHDGTDAIPWSHAAGIGACNVPLHCTQGRNLTHGSPGQNLDGVEKIGEVPRTVGLGHNVVFQVSRDLGLP